MNEHKTEIELNLINDKVKFLGKSGENQDITIDYVPPFGDGEGYTALELFLISFASCLSTTLLALIKKELQKNLISMKVKGYGERRKEHPKNFSNICFKYHIVSNDLTESELRKLVTLSETKYCPVWSMINENVKTNVEFIIEKG